MTKIFYGLLFGLLLVISGCSYNDPNNGQYDDNPSTGWVDFNDFDSQNEVFLTSRTGLIGCGDASIIEVPLILRSSTSPEIINAPVNRNGVGVKFTITDVIGNAVSQGVTATASVPAGSRTGKLVVDYPDNLSSSLEFLITLTSTDNPVVSVGAPDNADPVQYRIKINVGDRDRLTGSYDVLEDDLYEYSSEVTRGPAANELIITNLYDADPNSQTRVIVNGDGTISYPAFTDNFLYTLAGLGPIYLEGLTGSTYNACEGTITLRFRLRFGNGLNSATAPITTVLTRL
ncbi:hypothetical protein CHU92_05930 [Flavobacterium cyanobacteriorum]|uniref:DUF1735 domain-containing protein n=1 Tax=Flavobacterium cyanobacteriorum TaxID=2022802 RepID=A0A255Z9U6_9FLAO|nr:hypothetical protein [Flavobacterium cyanobacteriorum]OYQ38248.1 hypothetical protein CHU92_05930 [Flavobacterium cyanobacteriorum]